MEKKKQRGGLVRNGQGGCLGIGGQSPAGFEGGARHASAQMVPPAVLEPRAKKAKRKKDAILRDFSRCAPVFYAILAVAHLYFTRF